MANSNIYSGLEVGQTHWSVFTSGSGESATHVGIATGGTLMAAGAAVKDYNRMEAASIEEYVAQQFAQVPEVAYVLSKRSDNRIKFWTVVDHFEDAVFDQIFDRETRMRGSFKGGAVTLDFKVLTLEGRPLAEIANPAYIVWAKS